MFKEILSLSDNTLFESVVNGYDVLFESLSLPALTKVKTDDNSIPNSYQLLEKTDRKIKCKVNSIGKDKEPYSIIVTAVKIPEQIAEQFDCQNIVTLNFAKYGTTTFDASDDGSIYAFNATFAMLRKMVDAMNPDGLCYIPTDSNAAKAIQKARTYKLYLDRYFSEFKLVPQEELTEDQISRGIVYRIK